MRLAAFLALALCGVLDASPQTRYGQLLLAGGHLPVCSSVSPANCRHRVDWPAMAMTGRAFEVKPGSVRRLQKILREEMHDRRGEQIVLALMQLNRRMSGPVTLQAFQREFRALDFTVALPARKAQAERAVSIDGENIYQGLADRHWNAILDHMEIPAVDPSGRRRIEYVDVEASSSRAAIGIYTRFVEMARAASGRTRPRIAISTAASRDPYEAIDYYRGIFEQLGAEVIWLPLDAAVSQARKAGQCEDLATWQVRVLAAFERNRIDPQRFALQQQFCSEKNAGKRLLENVDGLFLNGGDQWLTLNSFGPADAREVEFETLSRRAESRRMVIGGTSAGTAVQSSGVMISNGAAATALAQRGRAHPPPSPGCERDDSCPKGLGSGSLTWQAGGGLATFPLGVLDTHFSQRNRQFRLLKLQALTGQRFGWGIDETTALEISFPDNQTNWLLRIHGAGNVWMIDTGQAEIRSTHPLQITDVLVARLTSGSQHRFTPHGGLNDHHADAFTTHSRLPDQKPAGCRTIKHFDAFDTKMDASLKQQNAEACVPISTAGGTFFWRMKAIPPPGESGGGNPAGLYKVSAGFAEPRKNRTPD